jgi:Secretion system C-terminal sorting domain
MKVKELLKNNLGKASVVLGLSLFSFNSVNSQTNVTVDASATWLGGMLVFENNATQDYLWYNDWGIDDIKTVRNTTDNTVELYPNYNVYNVDDAYWANGEMGNKIMQGMSYILDDALVGQQFTFSGTVVSNTLSEGYTAYAFVKAFDANWALLNETPFPLDEPGNFTINFNGTQYAGAAHIQYGFSVKGLNANPAYMEENGKMVITAGDPETNPGTGESVTIDLDASAAWVGGMLVFENNATQDYLWYNDWGIDDIKTVRNTNDNQVVLYPNYNAYNATDAYWANGDMGNKIMMGMSLVIDDTLLGENITFTGNVLSYTIADSYEVQAFVKTLDANWGIVNESFIPLTETGVFELNYNTADFPTAAHLQYGFSVRGLNANPAFMEEYGNVVIGAATASAPAFNKHSTTLYPNPVSNILNINSENTIDAVQIYNLIGQMVYSAQPVQNNTTVNVSGLTSGVYIVTTTIAGQQISERIIKQ